MKAGRLVPDVTVLDVVRERVGCLKCEGVLFSWFFRGRCCKPRRSSRSMREQGLVMDAVLDFVLPIDQIVARPLGAATCSNCKAVYHVTGRPPKVENVCDACGKALFQREDDRPESIRIRMQAYEESTSPLTRFYKARQTAVVDRGHRESRGNLRPGHGRPGSGPRPAGVNGETCH